MRWDGHVARMGAGNVRAGFRLGDLSERDHLRYLGLEGSVVLEWIMSLSGGQGLDRAGSR
jgi:hypothetical protein